MAVLKIAGSPGVFLLKTWERLSPFPGGAWLFSRLLRRWVPYSGSIGARVAALQPGYARVELPDRRGVQNHLDSIHALALANLGELTSGLALNSGLPAHIRGIVTRISIDYFKKARGRITAESHVSLPPLTDGMDLEVHSEMTDREGNLVARTCVRWRLGS